MAIKKAPQYAKPWQYEKPTGEINSGKQITQQGQHYSIRELLVKYTNGIMPPIAMQEFNAGDEQTLDSPAYQTLQNFDPVEQDLLLESTKRFLEEKKRQAMLIADASDTVPYTMSEDNVETNGTTPQKSEGQQKGSN